MFLKFKQLKTVISFILSLILAVCLLAPTVIIFGNDKDSVVIELNEDEKNKEEKKELNEEDSFLDKHINHYTYSEETFFDNSIANLAYIEKEYTSEFQILLRPPKHNF